MTDREAPGRSAEDTEFFNDGHAPNVLSGLLDFRFRTMTAMGAARALYLMAFVSVAVICVFLAVTAFQRSLTEGLVWALLICPALFVTAIVIVRVVIEFVVAILILMIRLEQTTDGVLTIVENTTDISAQTHGLPTLPTFARGLRGLVGTDEERRTKRKTKQERLAAQADAQEAADVAVQDAVDRAVRGALQSAADRAVQRTAADTSAAGQAGTRSERPAAERPAAERSTPSGPGTPADTRTAEEGRPEEDTAPERSSPVAPFDPDAPTEAIDLREDPTEPGSAQDPDDRRD